MVPVVLIALAPLGSVQTTSLDYDVMAQGKKVGTLKTITTYSPKGSSEKNLLHITQGGTTADLNTRTDNDSNGNWTLKTFEAKVKTQSAALTITPTASGAHVVGTINGEKKTMDVPKSSKTTTTDQTYRWFRGYTPKVGESVTFQRFDPQSLRWADTTTKYVGPKSVTVGGKPRAGFDLERKEGARVIHIIVDSQSFPILVDLTNLRFERVYK